MRMRKEKVEGSEQKKQTVGRKKKQKREKSQKDPFAISYIEQSN